MSNTSSKNNNEERTVVANLVAMIPGDRTIEVPEKRAKKISISDTKKMPFELGKVENFSYVIENDGTIYRRGENGEEFPPIDKEKYDKIAKLRKKEISKDKSKSKAKTAKRKAK